MANKFAHIELSTNDVKKAKDFYKKIFKWKLSPVKGMPYTMIDTGSRDVGGGMQPLPMEGAPTAWTPYVEVDDVPGTLAKAAKAGARIVVDYQELPGMGAIGMFIDPTGAALGIWGPQKKAAKSAKKKTAKKKKK